MIRSGGRRASSSTPVCVSRLLGAMEFIVDSPSNDLIELLSGKTPEAMYDALHAGRYLSEAALKRPAEVLQLIKLTLLSGRQRSFMPPTKIKQVAQGLAASGYLNERGISLHRQES
jgi:hypothetical protein